MTDKSATVSLYLQYMLFRMIDVMILVHNSFFVKM
jgi:hypothetical protein